MLERPRRHELMSFSSRFGCTERTGRPLGNEFCEAKSLQPRLRAALWEDLCEKVQRMDPEGRQKLCLQLAGAIPQKALEEFCAGDLSNHKEKRHKTTKNI